MTHHSKRNHWVKLAFYLAAPILLTTNIQAAVPASQLQALEDFYNNTNGTGWTYNFGWNTGITAGVIDPSSNPCTDYWDGISCDSYNPADSVHNITGIDLSTSNLVGTLPASIADLTELTRLLLDDNQLSGSIPDLSTLISLEDLVLSYNELTGSIPDLSALVALRTIHVENNQLTGVPPAAPASLVAGSSQLCPNYLTSPSASDSAWDTATGESPWSENCSSKVADAKAIPSTSAWTLLLMLSGIVAFATRRQHRRK